MAKNSSDEIYQLKITLKGSKPPIWRRVQTPASTTLQRVHAIIQQSMRWYNSHLHEFHVEDMLVGDPEQLCGWGMGEEPEVVDEADITLADFKLREGAKFEYVYDFGDDWQHQILLEKKLERERNTHYPICIKAVKAGPPEDVGGIWGYYNMLEALDDPEHPEHEEFSEWLSGEGWEPDEVSLEGINGRLKYVRV
jgi:hypothetical protein